MSFELSNEVPEMHQEHYLLLPDYLGGRCIEITDEHTPYQKLLLTVFAEKKGVVSEDDYRKLLPTCLDEAWEANTVVLEIAGAFAEAEKLKEESAATELNDEFIVADEKVANEFFNLVTGVAKHGTRARGHASLFTSAYNGHNQYAKYSNKSEYATKTVLKLPDAERNFVVRYGLLKDKIIEVVEEPIKFRGNHRYNDPESVRTLLSRYFLDRELSKNEQRILSMVHGLADIALNTGRDFSDAISIIGGGTAQRLLELRDAGHKLTDIERRSLEIVTTVISKLGYSAFKHTVCGRTMWGMQAPRHRSGDTLPKITQTKPGV